MAETRLNENRIASTTVVTAGDSAYAWGAIMLVASMRMSGMRHPVVVGAMEWPDEMKRRIVSLGDVSVVNLPATRQCVACQKPIMMANDAVKTDWVCWADADGMFVGDCSEWLSGEDADEIVIRKYSPVPPDFTPENLEIWRRDVERVCGRALAKSRYDTRVNTAFIIVNRKWRPFLARWKRQLDSVLPSDVGIIMQHGTAYFQTDESVLASLLCFDPEAPMVTENYKANGSADPSRYFAHFAYNPKPWQMWNKYATRWRDLAYSAADWLVAGGFAKKSDIPHSLRRSWWPLYRCLTPAAPQIWRAMKLKRKYFG